LAQNSFDNLDYDYTIANVTFMDLYDENEDKIILGKGGSSAGWSIGIFNIDFPSKYLLTDRATGGFFRSFTSSTSYYPDIMFVHRNIDGTFDVTTLTNSTGETKYGAILARKLTLNPLSNYVGATYETGVKGETKLVDYPNSVADIDGLTKGNFYYLDNLGLTTSPTPYKAGYAKEDNKLTIIK
jgi:hypothetical protein